MTGVGVLCVHLSMLPFGAAYWFIRGYLGQGPLLRESARLAQIYCSMTVASGVSVFHVFVFTFLSKLPPGERVGSIEIA